MQIHRDKAQETGWQKAPELVFCNRDVKTVDERKASNHSEAGLSFGHVPVKSMLKLLQKEE